MQKSFPYMFQTKSKACWQCFYQCFSFLNLLLPFIWLFKIIKQFFFIITVPYLLFFIVQASYSVLFQNLGDWQLNYICRVAKVDSFKCHSRDRRCGIVNLECSSPQHEQCFCVCIGFMVTFVYQEF